jgi:hypothetical protein
LRDVSAVGRIKKKEIETPRRQADLPDRLRGLWPWLLRVHAKTPSRKGRYFWREAPLKRLEWRLRRQKNLPFFATWRLGVKRLRLTGASTLPEMRERLGALGVSSLVR